MQSLEIEIDVNESYINRVEPGQAVEAALDAYPAWKIPCKVIAIIPTADRQKGSVKVKVEIEGRDERILPEMSCRVVFLNPQAKVDEKAKPKVMVPSASLVDVGGQKGVLLVANGTNRL